MYLIGVVGWKNTGKTTLVERLTRTLTNRDMRISTLKHTHHGVDLDRPGTDTFRHREAGAVDVALISSTRWAILHETRQDAEPELDDIIAQLNPVDMVIVEGFKRKGHDKIEVYRGEAFGPLMAASDPTVKAVVTDVSTLELEIPVFHPDKIEPLADFVVARGVAAQALEPAT